MLWIMFCYSLKRFYILKINMAYNSFAILEKTFKIFPIYYCIKLGPLLWPNSGGHNMKKPESTISEIKKKSDRQMLDTLWLEKLTLAFG